jgi:hypothetical protein
MWKCVGLICNFPAAHGSETSCQARTRPDRIPSRAYFRRSRPSLSTTASSADIAINLPPSTSHRSPASCRSGCRRSQPNRSRGPHPRTRAQCAQLPSRKPPQSSRKRSQRSCVISAGGLVRSSWASASAQSRGASASYSTIAARSSSRLLQDRYGKMYPPEPSKIPKLPKVIPSLDGLGGLGVPCRDLYRTAEESNSLYSCTSASHDFPDVAPRCVIDKDGTVYGSQPPMIYENVHDRRCSGLIFDLIEAPLIDVRQRNEVARPGPARIFGKALYRRPIAQIFL